MIGPHGPHGFHLPDPRVLMPPVLPDPRVLMPPMVEPAPVKQTPGPAGSRPPRYLGDCTNPADIAYGDTW